MVVVEVEEEEIELGVMLSLLLSLEADKSFALFEAQQLGEHRF